MKRAFTLAFMFALAGGEAHAHADGLPVGPMELWHHWSLDPWIWAPLLLAHWLYGRGVLRAWTRAGQGRIIERWRVAAFVAGEAFVVLALITPLDSLGETLLSAHMTQHILLTTLAPMLLVLGAPARAWTWALPSSWRRLGRAGLARLCVKVGRGLTRPAPATLLHVLTLWLWHTPVLFDAALRNEGVHVLEHATFFATASMFWAAMFRRDAAPAFAALLVLIVFMQCGMLGAVLTLAPAQLYDYGDRPMLWGLSGIEDQQIAGLLMWAPAALAYLAPFAWLGARILDGDQARGRRNRIGIMRASTSSRSMK